MNPHLTNINIRDEAHADCYRRGLSYALRLRKMNPLLEFSTKSIAYKDRGLLIFCAPRSQLRAELHEVCFVAL